MNESSVDYFLKKYSPEVLNFQQDCGVGNRGQRNLARSASAFEVYNEKMGATAGLDLNQSSRLDVFNKTRDLQEDTWKLKGEVENINQVMEKLQGKNAYLRAQVEFYENEINRLNLSMGQDRKVLESNIYSLKHQLELAKSFSHSVDFKTSYEISPNWRLQQAVAGFEEREKKLLDEISNLKNLIDRQQVELLTRAENKENQFSSQLKEKDLEIKRLKEENENLRSKCIEKDFSIKILNQELEDLKPASVLDKPTRSKKSDKNICVSPKRDLKKNKNFQSKVLETSESVYHKACKNPNFNGNQKDFGRTEVLISNQDKIQERVLKERVKKLEQEIANVNKDYRKLINSTRPGSSGYFKYKEEVDKLAKALEEKSKNLFDVKNKYSNLIRSYSLSSLM